MTPPASPARILEIVTAYQRPKLLLALVRLGIPALLADRPRPLDEIATELGVHPVAAERFLAACVALELIARAGDGYRNAPDVERFLVPGRATYLGELLGRHDRFAASDAWRDLPDRLRSWRPGGVCSDAGAPSGAEWGGQHRLSLVAGEALGGALDLSESRRLVDLGGGTGGMTIALCDRYPALDATVIERPEIVPIARGYVREAGLEGRIEVREGDFMAGALPEPCDTALIANVLSMLGADAARALLARLFGHLPEGGRVVLSGWMLGDDEASPLLAVQLCLEDIVLGAPDVERSGASYAAWLEAAGFDAIERTRYLEPFELVVARKPRARA